MRLPLRWLAASAAILLAACAPAVGQPLLVGVAPQLPSGEAEGFAVGSATALDLGRHQVTDGEGTWTFPPGTMLAAGEERWFSNDPDGWAAFGGPAAMRWSSPDLKLANGGDQLRLLAPGGAELDAMAWGDKTAAGWTGELAYTSKGLMYQRDRAAGAWLDTDDAADWRTPVERRIGATALDRPTFVVERVTAYSSPDSSHEVLTSLAAGATTRLHLHVYELRSATLVDALTAARTAHPGLDLQVLVDGNPVGMTMPERHATTDALRRVVAAGGEAWVAGNGRYDDWHLKVLVADDAVAVQSENWVDSGVPLDPSTGNRGWGIVLHSREAADWFGGWMAADRAAWDVAAFDQAAFDPTFDGWDRPAAPRTGAYGPRVPAQEFVGPFRVTPIVAPDHSGDPRTDPVAQAIAGARTRVVAQQLDLALGARNDLGWRGDDPWYEALKGAAARGVPTTVQLAAPFAADDTGNAEAVAALARHGAAASVMAREGIGTLHNKGFVVDGAVVVGSMNGNHHSRSANREVDVLVEGQAVADWYAALVAADVAGASAPRDWDVIGEDLKGIPAVALWPTVMLLAAVAWSRRWS